MMIARAAPNNAVRHLLTTMQHADPRLLGVVRGLVYAFIAMSLFVLALGCSPKLHIVNEGLDQATVLMLAMFPVLYFSGRQKR